MVSSIVYPSLGDTIEALRPDELRLAPSVAYIEGRPGPFGQQLLAVDGAPSNQQIIDAMKTFYGQNQKLVDTSATDARSGSQNHPQYVSTLNSYNWKDQTLPQTRTNTVGAGLGLVQAGAPQAGGLFGPTLDDIKATDLFTTIGIGISADVQFFVGGAGGLGAVFDIAKREGPKGYGYATGEIGLRIAAELNLQVSIFNLLPHELDQNIYGLKVSISGVLSLSFQVFFRPPGLTIMGYAVGVGVGIGGGATVFGGHIWHFG